MKRYALLDTDFISKTHSVQDDGGNHLIDRVIELPEYVLCGSNANECIIYNDGTNSRWLVWTNANCIFPLLGV